MAISKSKKQAVLDDLTARFEQSEGIAFLSFDRLTVMEVEGFRKYCRENQLQYAVVKKTLIALAAKQAGKAAFDSDALPGSVAVVTSSDDVVLPAAAIKKFKADTYDKKTKTSKVDYAGAVFNGEFLDLTMTAQLAETPTREESLGKIVGMLLSGPQKMHGILRSGLQGCYTVLSQAEKFTR